MFKPLKQFQIQLTPFQAAKAWNLNNVDNDDLLLFESTGSGDGEPLALEYFDYSSGAPILNYACNIALENQEADSAIYREGLKISGPFYESEPQNPDGTYKRSIYYQIKTSFYNDYRDPTKILGIENIDFENSQTKRKLADRLRMFDIPRRVFGDKIIPGTVKIFDTTLDNDYTVEDDGNGNLFAESNLFSKQQEIGNFDNLFSTGSNDSCFIYFFPLASVVLSGSLSTSSLFYYGTASLFWSPTQTAGASLILYRSTTTTYPSFSAIATPTSASSYNDNVTISSGYIYKLEVINASSSFSNEVTIPYAGVLDSFENYSTGQTASFNRGTGSWTTAWRVVPTTGLVSLDDMEDYSTNQTSSFAGGIGWDGLWSGSTWIQLVTYDTFDTYTIGQTGSFSDGYGWSGIWSGSHAFFATESFESYLVGQTSSFNSGSDWSGIWKII
jgi:hypothetical protein